MTQDPRREVEIQGPVSEPVALPLANDGASAYVWVLDLPAGVEAVAPAGDGRLRVRATAPGSHMLTATLAEPGAGTPMTVLPIRLTAS